MTEKLGFAAVGVSQNDFWNTYVFKTGTMSNLKFVDGTVSRAGLTVANEYGAANNTASDPMYASYIYSFEQFTLMVTNL